MKKIIYQKWIKRDDLVKNKDKIYLFGDNDQRQGYAGQAREMRGENNAIGIRVKKKPFMSKESFYTDREYKDNCKKIDEDFARIPDDIDIIIPSDGIGTGLALLDQQAPKTFNYLKSKLKELKNN